MATGILPPYQVAIVTHDSAISYSLNVLVNRTFFLPFILPFCHVMKKKIATKVIFLYFLTDRKIKKITLRNVHKFKKLSKVYCLS